MLTKRSAPRSAGVRFRSRPSVSLSLTRDLPLSSQPLRSLVQEKMLFIHSIPSLSPNVLESRVYIWESFVVNTDIHGLSFVTINPYT